jgi:hypothetical protein
MNLDELYLEDLEEMEEEITLDEGFEIEFEDCLLEEMSDEEFLLENTFFLKEEKDAGFLLKKVNKEKTLENIKKALPKIKKKIKPGYKLATKITPEIKKTAKIAKISQKLITLGINTADCMQIGGYVIMVFYAYRGIAKKGNIITVNEKTGKVGPSPVIKVS